MTTTMKLREITSTSWIASLHGERHAVLVQTAAKTLWLTSQGIQEFPNADELQKQLRVKLVQEEITVSEKDQTSEFHVGPWPCKHQPVFNIVLEPIPTYTKTANSTVRYAAGYWAFLFANGWQGSWCPKQATLDEYQHIGPFSSKLEMQTAINQKNSQGD